MGSDVNIVSIRELIKKGKLLLFILSTFCSDVSIDPSDETVVAVLQAEDGTAGVGVDSPALLPLQEPGLCPRPL